MNSVTLHLLHSHIHALPTSVGLSLFFNFGSVLGAWMVVQILSGVVLLFYYTPSGPGAFESVNYLMSETNCGWSLRIVHMNGASLVFFFLYLHLFKNLIIGSTRITLPWLSGALMLLVLMGIGFMGYSLVWSQMSYWAVVVITSLVSILPYLGHTLLLWVWGGFSVGSGSLKFFFVLHFILPFLIVVLIVLHLFLLHLTGSSSAMGYSGGVMKKGFSPYYGVKDVYMVFWLSVLMVFVFCIPFFLGEPDLFLEHSSMNSPAHIVPEWYFCTQYGVLRSVPSKAWGVLAMVLTLVEIFLMSACLNLKKILKKMVWFIGSFAFISWFLILMWLGQAVAVEPFVSLSLLSTLLFFLTTLVFLSTLV